MHYSSPQINPVNGNSNTTKKSYLFWIMIVGLFIILSLIPNRLVFNASIRSFNTVFQSILMEAFPFIFVGVFISSILHVFVTQETLLRIFPKNQFAALGVSAISGFFLPVCDCAIVPIASGLVKKGLPLHCAMTFMLAAPIVDPVVIAATFYAFPGKPQIAVWRVIIGITTALCVGIILLLLPEKSSPFTNEPHSTGCSCGCSITPSVGSIELSIPEKISKPSKWMALLPKVSSVLTHASGEFFAVGQYLILGAFISVAVQTFLPYQWLSSLSENRIASLLIMMAAAFLLSICSTADAFIARSFSGTFSTGSVMGFMAAGAMMDIKNYLMMRSLFTHAFVLKILSLSYGIAFLLLLLVIPFFT